MRGWTLVLVVLAVANCAADTKLPSKSTGNVDELPQKTTGKILFVAPVSSKSHKNFYYGLIEAMAKEGNQVTILTPYAPARPILGVREVVIEENDIGNVMTNAFTGSALGPVLHIMKKGPELCFHALGSPKVAATLKEDYDLVYVSMFFNECFLPYVHSKGIPFVFVNPAEMMGAFSGSRMGNIALASIDYNPMLNFPLPMNFWQRMAMSVSDTVMSLVFNLYLTTSVDKTGRELGLYSPSAPTIVDISANASLMVANSYRLAEHPRPYMPNILLAGGIHCKPSKPLPKDLEDWAASSGDAGFIYFSLGSAVRPSDVPEETVRLIMSVFKSLPQKVLWKYNLDTVPGGLPDNVNLTKWAPQQDLLGDPRIRLFITHGGLFSTQEATYHGVPVLGIPVFGDQEGNMRKAELQGWGKKLSWSELTYDLFRDTILSLLYAPEPRRAVRELRKLMRDRPTPPSEEVAWWTGYLLRTSGAPHLRSPAVQLRWYQLYNLDVWVTLVLLLLVLLRIQYAILRAVYRRCCGSRSKADPKKLKKN